MPKFARRKYLIDKGFQLKYVLLTMIMLLIYTGLLVAILFIPQIVALSGDTVSSEQVRAAQTLLLLHRDVWPAIGIVMIVMSAFTIFTSHKIAGPVYRFKKTLSDMAEGDIHQRVVLRKRDDLKDVAEHLNLVMDELNTFVRNLSHDRDLLDSHIDELEEKIISNDINPENGREMVERFRARHQEFRRTLDKFSNKDK